MLEHFSVDGDNDQVKAQLEDFIATTTELYISAADQLWSCSGEMRGGTIWLEPREPIPIEGGDSVQLCCPHSSGLYRFNLDIIEVEDDRIIATRSVGEPMGKRISLRGKISVPVSLWPAATPDADPATGQTYDISRSGMLVECDEELAMESEWRCRVQLWEDEALEVRAVVVRTQPKDETDDMRCFGMQFLDLPVEDQRKLLNFILASADLTADGGAPNAGQ